MTLKVSIVTISFNQADFLEEAILSVLNQSYDNIEYIIVDAGSTDGSREIIERYREQIDHIILEPDEGPADGLNKGFQLATGNIYGFLNADDMLLSDTIKKIITTFQKHPDADVISGHGYLINKYGKFIRQIYSHRFNLQAYAYEVCVLVQQSTFFRKGCYEKAGGMNAKNKIHWDGELWADMALNNCSFRRIHHFLSNFRMYETSISGSNTNLSLFQQEHQRIVREKIGIKHPKNNIRKNFYWLLTTILDPVVLFFRLGNAYKKLYSFIKR